ncbi:MAG: outer membrane protein assembly factor BamE [Betaproteobacteria bacterium]|nr:MAG: outer membrane protein assembly factor BamE [Betaproteobacteria bacterium]
MRTHTAAATLLATLALMACSKLTPENYDRLKPGMSYLQVKAILGDPANCSDLLTVKTCTWGDDTRYINVNFVADQVVLFNSANLR